MRVIRDIPALRRVVAAWRRAGERIAFVPTMGAIHAGHLSLVTRARRGADRVVASIFVNPLQFGPNEDYRRYPRPLARDQALLAEAGVDVLWVPEADDLYPAGHRTRVRVRGLSEVLEGHSRPGHFDGVTTVVAKLLNAVQPDVLWLGQKDAQQARVIEQMIQDLDLPVVVRRGPIVRDADGLALSSRNRYLSPEERERALALPRALATRSATEARAQLAAAPGIAVDYVETLDEGRVLAAAIRVGPTRLIDNVLLEGDA
jgi:pantoate--beta-alanine ligase